MSEAIEWSSQGARRFAVYKGFELLIRQSGPSAWQYQVFEMDGTVVAWSQASTVPTGERAQQLAVEAADRLALG
jgi:hypothetical protein